MSSISELISEQFKQLQPYKAGLTIEAIKAQYGLETVFKFASNESPFPPSAKATQAINDAIKDSHRYPDYHSLKSAIAENHNLEIDSVLLGSGSINVLDILFQAFSKEGCNAVFTSCSYFAYPILAQKVGLSVKQASPNQDLGHVAQNLIDLCDDKTAIVALDNPNNFSGAALNAEQIESLLEQVSPNTVVILDQAYEEFSEATPFKIDSQTFQRYPNLVVTRTFSKAYSLAALRVGYGLAHPELISWLSRGQQPFPVSNLAIAAAIASLHDKEYSSNLLTDTRAGREMLSRGLTALGLKCYPSNTNFVLADFGEQASMVYTRLLEQGYITRQMQVYQRPDLIRISVGDQRENEQLLKQIKYLLK